jgi:hypothetical protein
MKAPAVAAGLALVALPLFGCRGHASIHTIKLGTKKIKATGPLVARIEPDECYWWVDDDGQLCIAMRDSGWSLSGKPHKRIELLSLVLPGTPAGTGRDYHVNRRALRARRDAGYTHTRTASLRGIVGVWDYGRGRLKGRFRITALRQSYWVVMGWRADARVLILGEFEAIHDPTRGGAILARTEEDGMARRPPPGRKISPKASRPKDVED